MATGRAAKVAVIVFAAALLQVTVLTSLDVAGGAPDLLLVTLVAVAVLGGPVTGAAAGFFGGFVADLATLETLGLSSLLLTVVGYWMGRYGETGARESRRVPFVATVGATLVYWFGSMALHFVLGGQVSGLEGLVHGLPPTLLFNLLLAAPVFAVCGRLLATSGVAEPAKEVKVLG
jgi:rod shape-determining protein MreD